MIDGDVLAALLRGDPCRCACCERAREAIAAMVADGYALVHIDHDYEQLVRRYFPVAPCEG